MNSATELATQIANELGAAEMLQGPYLDAVPVIARFLTAYSLVPTASVSSVKKLADAVIREITLYGRERKVTELLANYSLALTAAVLDEVFGIIKTLNGSDVSLYHIDKYRRKLEALRTPERQSALDAYRDSMLDDAGWQITQRLGQREPSDGVWNEQKNIVCEVIRALKGSSDAAKEA